MPTLYDNFERVRQYIDQHQADVDLSSYVSYSYLESKHYLTEHQDLSSYVTKTDLSNAGYVSGAEISQMGYITSDDVSAMGYMTQADSYAYLSIENLRTNNNRPVQLRAVGLQFISSNYTIAPREISYEYINTSAYNNAWVGNTTLKNYVNGRLAEIEASYVTSSDLPVIDENIVPKATNTYTLGDAHNLYKNIYTKGIISDSNGINVLIGNNGQYFIGSSTFRPSKVGETLGTSTWPWDVTYTYNLILNGTDILDMIPVINENIIPKSTDTYTLGENTYHYKSAYVHKLYMGTGGKNYITHNNNNDIRFMVNGYERFAMSQVTIYPLRSDGCFGATTNYFDRGYVKNAYTYNIWTNVTLQNTAYSSSIVPKETTTYTLGDSSHIYSNTYSRGVYLGTGVRMFSEGSASSNDMAISLGGVSYFYLNTNRFAPNGAANNEKLDLGTADRKWNHIYGKSVNVDATYTDTAYLQGTSYTKSIVPTENESYTLGDTSNYYHTTYTNRVRGSSSVNFIAGGNNRVIITTTALRPMQQNYNLGSSDYPFATAYISNIYNFIWTGTSAEYAALSDYTTYQIYLIQEA